MTPEGRHREAVSSCETTKHSEDLVRATLLTDAKAWLRRARSRRLRRRIQRDPVGFNFFGAVSANLGLGVAARNTLTALRALGHPVAVTDVDPHMGRGGLIRTHCTPGDRSADKGRFPINMFHINPAEALGLVWNTRGLTARNRINLCVPFWELEELPADWTTFLGAMDVIVTPTAFIESAVRQALPDAICVRLPQAVPHSATPARDRARWGLPDDATVFLATFDLLSDPARKNPAGAINAFRAAFPEQDDVRLVLKTQPLPPEVTHKGDELRALIGTDSRIHLIQEFLSLEDLGSLLATTDVYVSLHRSEGLGLGLMEALTVGIPVIATAYSGPLDFLTDQNSELISFTRMPIDPELPVYRPMAGVSSWAEPDHGAAVNSMRRLANDPERRRRLGFQGQRDMARRRSAVDSGEAIRVLLNVLRDDELWQQHELRSDRLRALGPVVLPSLGTLRHVVAIRLKRVLRPHRASTWSGRGHSTHEDLEGE